MINFLFLFVENFFGELDRNLSIQKELKMISKKVTTSLMVIGCSIFFGSTSYASGCSEMAAFNTKINNALKTASFSQDTKNSLNSLVKECGRMHDMGMAVSSVDACNKALKIVAVN